jgi:dipeptidyl aminopeptidase/acylaminoacyl peptidase
MIFFVFMMIPFVAKSAPRLEDYGQLPTIENVAISPNGERIAYLNYVSGKSLLVVHSLKQNKRLQLVDVSNVKVRSVYFLNDNQIFLKAGEHRRVIGFRGKFDVSTGFSFTISTGAIKQLLTPGDGVVYPGQSGLGGVVGITSDGQHALMPAYYGEPMQIMGEWEDPLYALLKVNVGNPGKPQKYVSGTQETYDFFIGKDSEVLARIDYDDATNKHSVFAKHGKKWVKIFAEVTEYRTKSFVGLTPDNQHIIMLDNSDKTGRSALFKMALSDGKVTGPFYNHNDKDIIGVIANHQRIVQGVYYSGMTPSYTFFDAKLQARIDGMVKQFPEHSVWVVDISPDEKHVVILVEGSQSSGDYYLFSENQQPLFIAAKRSNIKPEDMNPLGVVTITARDGLKIPTIITIPKDKVSALKNLPAVMLPHGGPASYDSLQFDYQAQALAQQGYLVIQPQFRGSEGFGRDHETAGYGEWGGKMQDDLTDALSFFVKKGMVDSKRVCIVGSSYGGYAALAGGAFTPELYRCVVAINGIGDLKDFHSWVRNKEGRSSDSVAYWETQIGGGEYSSDIATARSPAHSAQKFLAETLIIYSTDDEVVPPSQSKNMANTLRKAGKSVKTLELKGDDHYLSLSETRLESLQALTQFVNEQLKPDAP